MDSLFGSFVRFSGDRLMGAIAVEKDRPEHFGNTYGRHGNEPAAQAAEHEGGSLADDNDGEVQRASATNCRSHEPNPYVQELRQGR